MKDGRIPPSQFDQTRYERPNKDWICGHACDGCACRIGPGPSGECRATTECTPRLVTPAGETKGTWKCTRPKDWGGACESGPLPDGTCCKTIIKCNPVRSLRARRGLVTRITLVAAAAMLLIAFGGGLREAFINPGPLSAHHSGGAFVRETALLLDMPAGDAGQGCVACHREAAEDFGGLLASASAAHRTGLSPARFIEPHPRDFSRIDATCASCHQAQTFHQANIARDTSCSVCHLEHRGVGSLSGVTTQNCTDCHGDPEQMLAARELDSRLPAALFEKALAPGLVVHPSARPAGGFTRVITGFAEDHPEFQVHRENHRDANTLKFNHRVHLQGEGIPFVDGKPLDCRSCHQPDASGAFMQRVSFEQHCRSCHALNFDETAPGLHLPHGDAAFTRAFLRSLPTHYADFARRVLGMTTAREVDAYVERQMRGLRERNGSGEALERAVFLSDAQTGEATVIAGLDGVARARFAGCAYCHEVTSQSGGVTPIVTAPATPDRWMIHSAFNHAKHAAMACTDCHAAESSIATADIIMPTLQSCVSCHSPQGNVSDSCVTCHTYHNAKPAGLPAALQSLILRQP